MMFSLLISQLRSCLTLILGIFLQKFIFYNFLKHTLLLYCRFHADTGGVAGEVAIEGASIHRVERFRYLGSIIQENGEIDEDINHRIKVGR